MVNNLYLVTPRGFCAGVEMAIKALTWMLKIYDETIYCYHEIVHNDWIVERFKTKNIICKARFIISCTTLIRLFMARVSIRDAGEFISQKYQKDLKLETICNLPQSSKNKRGHGCVPQHLLVVMRQTTHICYDKTICIVPPCSKRARTLIQVYNPHAIVRFVR